MKVSVKKFLKNKKTGLLEPYKKSRAREVKTAKYLGFKLPTNITLQGGKMFKKAQYADVVWQLNKERIVKGYKTYQSFNKSGEDEIKRIFINSFAQNDESTGETPLGIIAQMRKFSRKKMFQRVDKMWDRHWALVTLRKAKRWGEYFMLAKGTASASFAEGGRLVLHYNTREDYDKAQRYKNISNAARDISNAFKNGHEAPDYALEILQEAERDDLETYDNPVGWAPFSDLGDYKALYHYLDQHYLPEPNEEGKVEDWEDDLGEDWPPSP